MPHKAPTNILHLLIHPSQRALLKRIRSMIPARFRTMYVIDSRKAELGWSWYCERCVVRHLKWWRSCATRCNSSYTCLVTRALIHLHVNTFMQCKCCHLVDFNTSSSCIDAVINTSMDWIWFTDRGIGISIVLSHFFSMFTNVYSSMQ